MVNLKQNKLKVNGHVADLVIREIFAELRKAEEKFPGWPEDNIHGVAILVEEAGEAMQAALDVYYRGKDIDFLKKELAQSAAMAIRALFAIMKKEKK